MNRGRSRFVSMSTKSSSACVRSSANRFEMRRALSSWGLPHSSVCGGADAVFDAGRARQDARLPRLQAPHEKPAKAKVAGRPATETHILLMLLAVAGRSERPTSRAQGRRVSLTALHPDNQNRNQPDFADCLNPAPPEHP